MDKFTVTVVDNAWDNKVVDSREYTWDEFVERFKNHIVTKQKEMTPMLLPCSFKTIDEDYEPARMSKKRGHEIKYRTDGKPHIQRGKTNAKLVYMLPLDIDPENKDTDLTIEAAMERFGDFQYFAYTSSGHMTERKFGKAAFRMLLPFSKPITASQYELKAKSIIEWQGKGVDKCSPDVSRGFFIPSYLVEHVNMGHKYWVNEGKLLDPDIFEEAKPWVAPEIVKSDTAVKGGDGVHGKILWDTLHAVEMFQNLGLYIEHDHKNRHLVHCPWESGHSFESDGTVIYESDAIKKAGFSCLHGKCRDKSMYDVTKKIQEEHGRDFIKQFYDVEPYDNDIQDITKLLTDVNNITKKRK